MLIGVFVFAIVISVIVTVCLMQGYQKSVYDFAARVAANVQEHYPEAEEEIAKGILQDNGKTSEILNRYGITPNTIDLKINYTSFATLTAVLVISAIVGITIIVVMVVICYVKKEHRKIHEMIRYSEKVLDHQEALDIRDNDESDLSLLKNRIYDITVMLREKSELVEADNKKIEKLLADISHQIKTPLTSLNILNDLLYEELEPSKKEEFLNAMTKELKKVEWLIRNILNIAKIDSKTLILKKEEIQVQTLLEKCKMSFDAICELMRVSIRVKGEDPNVTMIVDEKWTSEAINNLIKNAIEHKAKTIEIHYLQTALYTQITITDDGEGIAKEDILHVFDRFYKAQNSKQDSMGLGLAFVKGIIESQNGDIRVVSKKEFGTMFVIKIYQQDI